MIVIWRVIFRTNNNPSQLIRVLSASEAIPAHKILQKSPSNITQAPAITIKHIVSQEDQQSHPQQDFESIPSHQEVSPHNSCTNQSPLNGEIAESITNNIIKIMITQIMHHLLLNPQDPQLNLLSLKFY